MSVAFDRLLNFYEAAALDPLTALAVGSTVVAGGLGAAGTIAGGQNAKAMGQFQQAEYAQQGETATATAQRAMLEQRREGTLVESTLQARSAGQGTTSTDPSTLNLGRQIAGRSEYSALMDLSQGENQQAGLTNMGAAAAYGGNIAQTGDMYSAYGTIAGSAGSAFRTLSYGNPSGMPNLNLGGANPIMPNNYSTAPYG
jgi:hypothetical protein